MAANKLIMSWAKLKIEIGETGDSDAMATTLTSIGTIKDKSTTMTSEDGDKLEAKATGGVVVATEEGEPTITITTRVMEPEFNLEKTLLGATLNTGNDEATIKTNVVSKDYSVKLTPKNIGSTGIKARKTHISYKPGHSEEEGQYVDLTFTILACADGELYKKFKVKEDDWTSSDV